MCILGYHITLPAEIVLVLMLLLQQTTADTCGNGALEPIATNSGLVVDCSNSSTHSGHESCDFSHNARFGTFEGSCTANCTLELNIPAVISGTGTLAQRESGVLTRSMKNTRHYDFGRDLGHYSNSIAPCLYTTNSNCSDLSTSIDRFALLKHCYNVDPSSVDFGIRHLDNTSSMMSNGHKCPHPVDIVANPVGGVQSWDAADQLYDVCFALDDTLMWPATSRTTNQFVPQSTSVQYHIVCDSAVNDDAIANCDDPAEACSRLGGTNDVCGGAGNVWDLVACDVGDVGGETCTPLPRDTDGNYNFALNSGEGDNPLECSTKIFDNAELAAGGHLGSSWGFTQGRYVGSNGYQSEEPDVGEVAHYVDTCAVPYNKSMDRVRGSASNASLLDSDFLAATTYTVGCSKRLRLKVFPGYSGSMLLSIGVRSTSTVEGDGASSGYLALSKTIIPVSITAQVQRLQISDPPYQIATTEQASGEGILYGQTDLALRGVGVEPMAHAATVRYAIDFVDLTPDDSSWAPLEQDTLLHRFELEDQNGASFSYSTNRNITYDRGWVSGRHYGWPYRGSRGFEGPLWGYTNLSTYAPNLIPRFWDESAHYTNYHTGMSPTGGLQIRPIVHAWEPTSCSISTMLGPVISVDVDARNPKGPVVISTLTPFSDRCDHLGSSTREEQIIFMEDEQVHLGVVLEHPDAQLHRPVNDSSVWYFTHLDVTNIECEATFENETITNQFDLFVQPVGIVRPPSVSAVVPLSPHGTYGVGLLDVFPSGSTSHERGHCRWRSYANSATREIVESENTSSPVDFSSVTMTSDCGGSPAQCLIAAQRPDIWKSLRMRPCRKCTKNTHLRITACMRDGIDNNEKCTSIEKSMVHIPMITRYDQAEILQSGKYKVQEQGKLHIRRPFGTDLETAPIPYTPSAYICTYVHNETHEFYGTVDSVDGRLDTAATSRDLACTAATVSVQCPPIPHYQAYCVRSGAVPSRLKFRALILAAAHPDIVNETYMLPGGDDFSPAGNNPRAWSNGPNVGLAEWNFTNLVTPGAFYSILGTGRLRDATWCNQVGVAVPGQASVCTGLADVAWSDYSRTCGAANNLSQESLDFNGIGEAGWYLPWNGTSGVPQTDFVFEAKSNMNTLDGVSLMLGMTFTVRDCVEPDARTLAALPAANNTMPRLCATSVSTSSKLEVEVTSIVQPVVQSLHAGTWSSSNLSHIVEEGRDWSGGSRPWETEADHLWSSVAGANVTMDPNVDCPPDYPAGVFCFEHLHLLEGSTFRDERVGDIDLRCSISNPTASIDHLLPAPGLFEILACNGSTWDSCHVVGSQASEFELSSAASAARADTGMQQQSDWTCAFDFTMGDRELLSQPLVGQQDELELGSVADLHACRFRSKNWHKYVDPSVPRPALIDLQPSLAFLSGANASTFEYKAGDLASGDKPRAYKSQLRMRFPMNWGNGLKYSCSIATCSHDRDSFRVGETMVYGETKCSARVAFDVAIASVAQRPSLEYRPTNGGAVVVGAPVSLNIAGDALAVVHSASERITVQAGVPFPVPLTLLQSDSDRLILPVCDATMSHEGDGRCIFPTGRLEPLLKPLARCTALSVESLEKSTGMCMYLPSLIDYTATHTIGGAEQVLPVDRNWDSLPGPSPERSAIEELDTLRPGGCRAALSAHKFAVAGDYNGNLAIAEHLLLQYPSDRLADDTVRICGESCGDHREGVVSGFYTPRACLDIGIKVIPSIPAETVSLCGLLLDAEVTALNPQQYALLNTLPGTAYALGWGPQAETWRQQGVVGTVSSSGMVTVEVNEDNYADGFMVGIELGQLDDTMRNDGTWAETVTPVSIMVSIESAMPQADERMPQHVAGESWAVGVAKTPRQLFVSPPMSLTGAECNVGLEFDVVISPSVGQPESAVSLLRSENRLAVRVVDDDRFGELEFRALRMNATIQHDTMFFSSSIDLVVEVQDDDWRLSTSSITNSTLQAARSEMGVVLERRFSAADRQGEHLQYGLLAYDAVVQVDAKAHERGEYGVHACNTISNVNGSFQHHFGIDFSSCVQLQLISENNQYLVRMGAMAAIEVDETQTIVVLVVAHAPLSCRNGETPVISAVLDGLRYVDGKVFNPRNMGCNRPETLQQSTSDAWRARLAPSVTVAELRTGAPFQASFAMVDAVAGTTGGTYDGNPLASSLGLAAEAARLSERSFGVSPICASDTDLDCGSMYRFFVCSEPRRQICQPIGANGALVCGGARNTTIVGSDQRDPAYEASVNVLFVDLKDSDREYSKLGKNYEVSCPSFAQQQMLNLRLSGNECPWPDFRDATSDAIGLMGSCPVVCYNVSTTVAPNGSAVECGPTGCASDDPMRAMLVFRRVAGYMTEASSGRDSRNNDLLDLSCPGSLLTGGAGTGAGEYNMQPDLMHIDADLKLDNLPYVHFRTKPDGIVTATLEAKLRLVYGADQTGSMATCGFSDQSSENSRGVWDIRIADIEMFNRPDELESVFKEDIRFHTSPPKYIRSGTNKGKLQFEVTLPFAAHRDARVITNVQVGTCPDTEDVFARGAWANDTGHPFANFGDCSLFDLASVVDNQTNANLFSHWFGESACPPTRREWETVRQLQQLMDAADSREDKLAVALLHRPDVTGCWYPDPNPDFEVRVQSIDRSGAPVDDLTFALAAATQNRRLMSIGRQLLQGTPTAAPPTDVGPGSVHFVE